MVLLAADCRLLLIDGVTFTDTGLIIGTSTFGEEVVCTWMVTEDALETVAMPLVRGIAVAAVVVVVVIVVDGGICNVVGGFSAFASSILAP